MSQKVPHISDEERRQMWPAIRKFADHLETAPDNNRLVIIDVEGWRMILGALLSLEPKEPKP